MSGPGASGKPEIVREESMTNPASAILTDLLRRRLAAASSSSGNRAGVHFGETMFQGVDHRWWRRSRPPLPNAIRMVSVTALAMTTRTKSRRQTHCTGLLQQSAKFRRRE